MEVQVKKTFHNSPEEICFMDNQTYNSLKIDKTKPCKLHLGQLYLTCNIKPCEESSSSIYIPAALMDKLLLYDNITLNIWKKNNDIFLGPVVGMFLSRRIFESCATGKPTPLIIEHIKEAGPFSNCLSYCFCAYNIDLENNKIMGYTFIEKLNQWRFNWLPAPDVVYDRAVYLEKGEKELAKGVRQELILNSNIRFINPVGSLGKWPLYKKLTKHAEIKNHLPETILYKNTDDVFLMLNKYSFVFLKSSFGSRGEEVLSIEKIDDKYRIDFNNEEIKIYFAENISELKIYIEEFIKDKQDAGHESFIVQQGIPTIKYNGHSMIFRIDAVKNEDGKWQTINPYGTYASGDSNITNFCLGGIESHFEDIYPKLQNIHTNIILPTQEEILSFTKKMAVFIEKSFGPYGEIGIDILLDKNGKLWFLEGNAKPDKSRIPGFDNTEGIAPQALAIFKYSKYLAKNTR